ncbi:hypothetical protein [Paenibacillus sp. OV219]|uniref:hypothetical protein n=1 Tax=Paenibacillus sp. OV219 TaxID=1884377 RepID=UPI00116042DA|nr:hypothetical protein [Paenibacillus sp. OV219]
MTTTKNVDPGYYWCQHLDGHWSTDSTIDGVQTSPDNGGEPAKKFVHTSAGISVPTDTKWEDMNGNVYTYSQVNNPVPISVSMQQSADPAIKGAPKIEYNEVTISGFSGKGVYGFASNKCGTSPSMIYPVPVTVTFQATIEVPPTYEVHNFTTDGNSIDDIIPSKTGTMTVGSTYPPVPGTNSNYVYAGKYKKTTNGTDPTSTAYQIGTPSITYDGSFDTYRVNYYYTRIGKIVIKHYDEDGKSLNKVAGLLDREQVLNDGQSYQSFTHDEPNAGSDYTYTGYKKATNAGDPTSNPKVSPPSEYNFGTYSVETYGNIVYLNFYYMLAHKGEVHVRHMVRNGPTGTYTQANEELLPIATLPFTNTTPYKADSQYGKINGSNLSYVTYIDYQGSGDQQTVNLTTSQKEAYITFYYEKNVAGQVQIRHMVREGPSGVYKQVNLIVEDVSALPFNKPYSYDSQYGNFTGSNLSYVNFSDLQTPNQSQSVYLSATNNDKGFVSFFYEKPAKFTGDFDVVPSNIAYKDSFKLHPKDFSLNGCVYQYHYYKIERDGTSWQSGAITGMNTDSNYPYSDYPWNIGIGSHDVSMKIVTNCGTSEWIGPKGLNVTGPTNNNPPEFQIGFVYPYDNKNPIHEVLVNTMLDLIYINDPDVPTPTDPDGDTITFMGFDFMNGNDFVQSIPSKSSEYADGQHAFVMDTLGYHSVCGMMRDTFGATATACTYIKVVPLNPIPVIDCPTVVTANHPVDMTKFSASRSRSPVSGRTIDHSRDEWSNKNTTYENFTNANINAIVSLDVYDNKGLKSVDSDRCTIVVKPDLPPIAKLLVPSVGLRGETVTIPNLSTSPDGDKIVKAEYKYKYDANQNGFYDNDWQDLTGTLDELTFIPNKVGRYLFYVKVTEDYGMTGDTSGWTALSNTLNVSNLAPEVSFDLEGKNPQPDLNLPKSYPAQDILDTWDLFDMNSKNRIWNPKVNWTIRNGTLEGGLGKQSEHQYVHSYEETYYNVEYDQLMVEPGFDFGYGANGFSPYRSGKGQTMSQPVLDKRYNMAVTTTVPVLRTNGTYFYFKNGSDIYAMNKSKITKAKRTDELLSTTWSYTGGSPYDFILSDSKISSFELGDRTLYVFLSNDVYTYDAFTGELVSKATLHGWDKKTTLSVSGRSTTYYASFKKNDNVVVFAKGKAYEFNRNAELVQSKPIAARPNYPTCTLDSSSIYSDGQGNFYGYETCTTGNQNTSILKYNSNLDLVWRADLSGKQPVETFCSALSSKIDSFPVLIVNSAAGELIARSYDKKDSSTCKVFQETVNLDSGSVLNVTGQYSLNSTSADFSILPDGSVVPRKATRKSEVMTIDGYRTSLGNTNKTRVYPYLGGSSFTSYDEANSYSVYINTTNNQYVMYIGDGLYVSLRHIVNNGYSIESELDMWLLQMATPSTETIPERFRLGHFVSKDEYADAELNFSMKMASTTYDNQDYGFSFRVQDLDNRYAVEGSAIDVKLVKYVGGTRTVLGSAAYPFKADTNAVFKIKAIGKELTVFLNKVPIIEVQDSSFASGRFGPYSDKANVNFWGISVKQASEMNIWSDQYAILDESGTYASAEAEYSNIVFNDPEGDPPTDGKYTWSVKHTPRFIHNQGVSDLNGKTFSNAQLKFDKVGDYVVGLRAKDDPNPDYLSPDDTFDDYRKLSNTFTKKITVHRRPISDFNLAISSDNTVIWTDRSRDPDRYVTSTDYSTEDTGIDYKATKGIMEKRFYYITPSGDYVDKKLVNPKEVGTYEVGMAVRDEYGAWSEYTVVNLTIAALPAPNTPPVPGFTMSAESAYRGEVITIDSEAYDKEDGDRTNLAHEYYIINETTGSAEVFASNSRTSWDKAFNTMGLFTIRQVVQDSEGATAPYSQQVSIVNQIPSSDFYIPDSTDQGNPTKLTLLRPTFKWNYADSDGDRQTQYEMKIYRYGGVLEYQSGTKYLDDQFWTPGADLPEKVNMYAIVRVFDGYDWSEYSDPKYFYIETNRPPTAELDWKPKPIYEGDNITLLPSIDDPDHDPLTVTYLVTDQSGAKQSFAFADSYPYTTTGPTFKGQLVGSYTVQMTVTDGKAPLVTVNKLLIVLPLSVSGQVKHTEQWDQRRKESNKKASGDENNPRAYQVFWAGERFMLSASTTDAGTATVADEVKVTMNGVTVNLTAANSAHTSWSGEMWEADFEKLPEGPLTFMFKAIYSNGMVKLTPVTIVIAGNIQQTVGVHRRQ